MAPAHSRKYRRIIVWMRRGARVRDNVPLWHAAQDGDEIIPAVCLGKDRRFAEDTPRRRFLRSAFADLDARLHSLDSALYVLRGAPGDALPAAVARVNADAVYAAAVYDPDARERDHRLSERLAAEGCELVTFKDAVIFEHQELLTATGSPYKVFTPYKRAWLEKVNDAAPPLPDLRTIHSPPMAAPFTSLHAIPGFDGGEKGGGESGARTRLKTFMRRGIAGYRSRRDLPDVDGTSRLSAELANGTISIRTVLHASREALEGADRSAREGIETFISELIWREFYYQILFHFPFVVRRAFKNELAGIRWSESRKRFAAWCEGRTGYPMVDAAMRQLKTEGWMHNRARMIVASFLTKDLHINWQWGERYFLERLVDADIASNNGGWQWTAGTGTDASPYFRILNPVLQGEKYDPRGDYVRRYLPEIRHVPVAAIHAPWMMTLPEQKAAGCVLGKDYPAPMVDHGEERVTAMKLFKRREMQERSVV